MMKFSLVVPTKGRTVELLRLFQCLKEQRLQDFEIIVSDQNTDDRVVDLLKEFNWPEKVIRIQSSGGASSARNAGIKVARGDIIGFPDDDCTYFPDTLERVGKFFDQHPEYGFLTGRSVADDGTDSQSSHAKEAGEIEKYKIYQQGIEFTMFLRRSSVGNVRFDERLGTGCPTPWQSDEGPDLMLNLKEQGVRGYYDPSFAVWHPRAEATFDEDMVKRCYRYACGTGYFLRKHRYPWWFFAKINLRTFCGVVVSLLTLKQGKARYFWARIQGRWVGWTGYDTEVRGHA